MILVLLKLDEFEARVAALLVVGGLRSSIFL